MKRIATLVSALGLVIATAAVTTPQTANGLDTSKGYAGVCTGADATTGVTIVVDFQELNGNGGTAAPTITRCSPNATPGAARTGLKALQDAGFALAGTSRWGLAFICRIEGRPSATESLPVTGNPTYKEPCVNTPPTSAYWGYWHANGTGQDWQYSTQGASSRNVTPGGFEGWSFSLNRTATTNPKPRVTPVRPGGTPAPTVTLVLTDADNRIKLGKQTTIKWTSTNATTLTASAVSPATGGGAWSGTLTGPNGNKVIKPTKKGTFTYTISATTGGTTVKATTKLTVI